MTGIPELGRPYDASRIVKDREAKGVDTRSIEQSVVAILHAIGEDPAREGLQETPARVGRAWAELTYGMREDPAKHLEKTFALESNPDDLIVQRGIPFYSLCEHHLVPFFGVAHVGYIPSKSKPRYVGLSKIARCVKGYGARLQTQEQMTRQIANAVANALHAQGVAVILEAEHLCLGMRGVKAPGTLTRTSCMLGVFASQPDARAEALTLLLREE